MRWTSYRSAHEEHQRVLVDIAVEYTVSCRHSRGAFAGRKFYGWLLLVPQTNGQNLHIPC
jgi:hypothetical protein